LPQLYVIRVSAGATALNNCADKLPTINVNISGHMQLIIHNVNTEIDRPSCKRNTNTQADMWARRRVKPVLTVD